MGLLTHPAKTVCEAIFVNKKSQSAKAKDFAVSAQMRREAHHKTSCEFGQGVSVMFASHKREHIL